MATRVDAQQRRYATIFKLGLEVNVDTRVSTVSAPKEQQQWRGEPSPPWPAPAVGDVAITGDRYTSRVFFADEWEHMWTKVWLLLGRSVLLPEPGDYQVEEVGPESIIMARQPDGSVRSFYNVCQHRGSRLTFATKGSTDKFTCPYHGWTYGTDGTLVHLQDAEDFPGNPCEDLRLAELKTEEFAGFVWVSMDPDAGPLREFLGPLYDEWAAYQVDEWPRVTALTANVDCNWKVIQDNFCESYHLPTVHRQLMESHEESYRNTDFQMSEAGHNRMIMLGAQPSVTQYGDDPPLPQVLRDRLETWELDPQDFVDDPVACRLAIQAQMRKLGPERGHHHYDQLRDQQFTDAHHYNLFPNCSLTFNADGLLMQRMRPHPTDPEKCVFDHWYYAFDAVADGATNIRLDGADAEHQVFDYGDRPMGLIPDQDISITQGQQLGMRSRGFTHAILGGQETRVAWFHQVIDEYIAGDRPKEGST